MWVCLCFCSSFLLEALSGDFAGSQWGFAMDFPETFITREDTVQFKHQHDWPGDGEGEYQKTPLFWCIDFVFVICFKGPLLSSGRRNWIIAFQKNRSNLPPEVSPVSHFKLNASLNFYPTCYSGSNPVWKAEFCSKSFKPCVERLKRTH